MGKYIFLVFALFLIFNFASAGFRLRRRRRTQTCDKTPCSWQWGSCSASCGPGTQTAAITRQKGPCGACLVPSPRSCNKMACPEVLCTEDNPQEVCDINAVCLHSACHCLPGFRGDGKICADENECTKGSHDCSDNAKCINSDGAFDCECKDGYEGDGFLCEDKDECELQTADCHQSAACMNNDGGYDCFCFPGFHGNGFSCTRCKDKNRQCSRWQKRGYCDHSSHRVFMNHICQTSCKIC